MHIIAYNFTQPYHLIIASVVPCSKIRTMRHILFLFSLLLTTQSFAYDWGKTGHRVTGEVAQQLLTKKTKRAISQLLEGESLASASTYGDDIKSDSRYKEFNAMHYVNVPFDKTYDTHPKNEQGDIITGIDKCIAILKSGTASKEDKAFYLRMLVHFIGDLHQPLHAGIGDDKGGNDFKVRWFSDGTNLHRVWDTSMIEDYGMSYSELAFNLPVLDQSQLKSVGTGTHRDWLEDSRALVKDIYANTESGEKLGYNYMYKYFDTVKSQLQKAGVRLAALLNELLG